MTVPRKRHSNSSTWKCTIDNQRLKYLLPTRCLCARKYSPGTLLPCCLIARWMRLNAVIELSTRLRDKLCVGTWIHPTYWPTNCYVFCLRERHHNRLFVMLRNSPLLHFIDNKSQSLYNNLWLGERLLVTHVLICPKAYLTSCMSRLCWDKTWKVCLINELPFYSYLSNEYKTISTLLNFSPEISPPLNKLAIKMNLNLQALLISINYRLHLF